MKVSKLLNKTYRNADLIVISVIAALFLCACMHIISLNERISYLEARTSHLVSISKFYTEHLENELTGDENAVYGDIDGSDAYEMYYSQPEFRR